MRMACMHPSLMIWWNSSRIYQGQKGLVLMWKKWVLMCLKMRTEVLGAMGGRHSA